MGRRVQILKEDVGRGSEESVRCALNGKSGGNRRGERKRLKKGWVGGLNPRVRWGEGRG